MSKYGFTIIGRLPGLNDYTKANRTSFRVGAQQKKDAQINAEYYIKMQLKGIKVNPPVILHYRFFEQNMLRDHDNVSGFAHKVIQDALVKQGILKDDGWNYISGYRDDFYLDRKHPRIEVTIEEVNCEQGNATSQDS